jgi:hypothetical protein
LPLTNNQHRYAVCACRNASTLDATGYWIGVWNPSTANATTFYYGDLQYVDGRVLPKSASEDPYAHWWVCRPRPAGQRPSSWSLADPCTHLNLINVCVHRAGRGGCTTTRSRAALLAARSTATDVHTPYPPTCAFALAGRTESAGPRNTLAWLCRSTRRDGKLAHPLADPLVAGTRVSSATRPTGASTATPSTLRPTPTTRTASMLGTSSQALVAPSPPPTYASSQPRRSPATHRASAGRHSALHGWIVGSRWACALPCGWLTSARRTHAASKPS